MNRNISALIDKLKDMQSGVTSAKAAYKAIDNLQNKKRCIHLDRIEKDLANLIFDIRKYADFETIEKGEQ